MANCLLPPIWDFTSSSPLSGLEMSAVTQDSALTISHRPDASSDTGLSDNGPNSCDFCDVVAVESLCVSDTAVNPPTDSLLTQQPILMLPSHCPLHDCLKPRNSLSFFHLPAMLGLVVHAVNVSIGKCLGGVTPPEPQAAPGRLCFLPGCTATSYSFLCFPEWWVGLSFSSLWLQHSCATSCVFSLSFSPTHSRNSLAAEKKKRKCRGGKGISSDGPVLAAGQSSAMGQGYICNCYVLKNIQARCT